MSRQMSNDNSERKGLPIENLFFSRHDTCLVKFDVLLDEALGAIGVVHSVSPVAGRHARAEVLRQSPLVLLLGKVVQLYLTPEMMFFFSLYSKLEVWVLLLYVDT